MKLSPIDIQVINQSFIQIAEQAGVVLQRSSFSPNIKERLDFSVGIYGILDNIPKLIGQAEHIPVHLGAMSESLKYIQKLFPLNKLRDGDVIITNDPYLGGTHLPDIALTRPIFYKDSLIAIVTNRAHHADVGGIIPGSMPAGKYSLEDEGVVISPRFIQRENKLDQKFLNSFLSQVRSPEERKGDLNAQLASLAIASEKLKALYNRYSTKDINEAINFLGRRSRNALITYFIEKLPERSESLCAVDYLDNDGVSDSSIEINVEIYKKNDVVIFDFTKSANQVEGNINATSAVVAAACFYVIRCLIPNSYSTNFGLFQNIKIITRSGSILNPKKPAGVAGGNVETSQRLVDVILKALAKKLPLLIPAASCGTMNNITIGSSNFTYYETIAGGHGASHNGSGITAHTHMTNTGNTPIEILESHYPIEILEYSLIDNSEGLGQHNGGRGIRRSFKVNSNDVKVSLLTERRKFAPYGIFGGKNGRKGYNILVKDSKSIVLPSKTTFQIEKGDIIIIETPGGGGYGNQNS